MVQPGSLHTYGFCGVALPSRRPRDQGRTQTEWEKPQGLSEEARGTRALGGVNHEAYRRIIKQKVQVQKKRVTTSPNPKAVRPHKFRS